MSRVLNNEYHDKEASDRLAAIHAERTSSPETISAIVREGIGKNVSSYDRVVRGEVNEVYIIHPANGDEVILRIAHRKTNKFEPEAWAIEQAGVAGVPVPEVYAVGSFEGETRLLYFSIQKQLAGKTFDNMLYIEHIEPARARAITEQAGELLARIHSVKTEGYGPLDKNGKGRYPTNAEFMGHRTTEKVVFEKLFNQMGLSLDLLNRTFAELDNADNLLEAPHLVHHDYGPKHMFVNEADEIVGIIDFEDVNSGDATIDFSGWKFWFDEEAPMDWLLAGYKRERPLGDNFEERLKIARIYRMLGLMNYYTNKAPYPKWANAAAETLKQLMEQK